MWDIIPNTILMIYYESLINNQFFIINIGFITNNPGLENSILVFIFFSDS